MLNWNYLETFAILSENLSFSQTARVLNTAQPVVSRQIKVLEHSLGYPLFIRSKKKVALSEQGKLLKQRLRPLIDEMKRVLFEQEIGNEAAGVIRMASMFEAGQLLLFPRLKEILEDHPKLQLHFTLMPSLNINEAVLAGLLDFGFTYRVGERKSILSRPVIQDTPVLVADVKMAKKWRESQSYSVIGYREKDPYLEGFLERNFSKSERRKVQMGLSINSHLEIIELLRSHPEMMATIPLSSAKKAVEKGQLQILVKDKKPQDLYLICHEQTLIDKRKKAFWDLMVAAFATS